MGISDLKTRMRDIPGIGNLTMQMLGGRQTYGVNGHLVALDAGASELEAEKAIRAALASDAVFQMPAGTPALPVQRVAEPSPSATLIPPVTALAPAPSRKAISMTTPAPGSFASQLKAIIDEARAGVDTAKAQGLAKVRDAVGNLEKAAQHTLTVSESMAETINAQADDVLAELGQISNLPPE